MFIHFIANGISLHSYYKITNKVTIHMGIQMPFQLWAIQLKNYFPPFEYQAGSLFRFSTYLSSVLGNIFQDLEWTASCSATWRNQRRRLTSINIFLRSYSLTMKGVNLSCSEVSKRLWQCYSFFKNALQRGGRGRKIFRSVLHADPWIPVDSGVGMRCSHLKSCA